MTLVTYNDLMVAYMLSVPFRVNSKFTQVSDKD